MAVNKNMPILIAEANGEGFVLPIKDLSELTAKGKRRPRRLRLQSRGL